MVGSALVAMVTPVELPAAAAPMVRPVTVTVTAVLPAIASVAVVTMIRVLVGVALVAVLALSVLSAVGWYARDGYFVGFAGQGEQAQLVVFKGRANHILWFRPTIEIDSGVARQEIFPSLADDIDDQPKYDSLARAEAYVNSIRDVIAAQKPAAGDGT